MNHIGKRFTALLLVLSMFFSLSHSTVWASETVEPQALPETEELDDIEGLSENAFDYEVIGEENSDLQAEEENPDLSVMDSQEHSTDAEESELPAPEEGVPVLSEAIEESEVPALEEPDISQDETSETDIQEECSMYQLELEEEEMSDSGIQAFSVQAAPEDGDRYTVLLLDRSGSMSGTPLNTAKQAAQKFCMSMLEADGINYIAVVSYGSNSSVICNYSNEMDVLKNKINGISANGGTNTNSALVLAQELIESVPDSAVKNVVLLSDGLPIYGSQSASGPYTSSDSRNYYTYANAVYATSQELQMKCNLYTLGFFHSLRGTELAFGQRLMEDIQNKGYYNVTDVNDLEFVFGEISKDITESELKKIYIRQHKEYIQSSEYEEQVIGGFDSRLNEVLNDVNKDTAVWNYHICDVLNDSLQMNLDLTEEYEILLAQLMVNEQTYEGIRESFLTNLQEVSSDIFSTMVTYMDQYTTAEKVAVRNKMVDLVNQMEKQTWLSDEYCTLYEEYAQLVNQNITASQAKEVLGKLSFAGEVADVVLSTASETMEYIGYGQAYVNTSEDFTEVLVLMDYYAGVETWTGTGDGLQPVKQILQMAEVRCAIQKFISSMEDYKTSQAKAIAGYAGEALTSKTVNKIGNAVTDMIFSKLPVFKVIPALKGILESGLTLVDLCTDLDERAYAGNMLGKLYYLTVLADDAADMAGDYAKADDSSSDAAFHKAAVFDEAVNIYKASVMLACDFGMMYEEYRLKAERDSIFSSAEKMSWYSTAISIAALDKMFIGNIQCHSEGLVYDHVTKVINYDSTKLKIFAIACPVAVTVKDASGNQIAYLSDDEESIKDGYGAYFHRLSESDSEDGLLKIAVVPEDFEVTLTGTGTGKMDVYIGIYSNGEITEAQSFKNIPVIPGSQGTFRPNDSSTDRYDLTMDEKTYFGDASDAVTVKTDADSYICAEGQTLKMTAKISTPGPYEQGSHKYIGYFAYLYGGQWHQLKSWYIDGGVTSTTISIKFSSWNPKGKNLFTISVFPADNFTTGASLYDCMFHVNVLEAAYTAVFDPDGGTCSVKNSSVIYGCVYGDLPEPERVGYTFGGWYTQKNGNGIKILSNATVTATSDQILYACWKPKTYTVVLNANGGTCLPLSIHVKYDGTYSDLLGVNITAPENSVFDGWYTSASGGTKIEAGSKVTIPADHTLYAQWKHVNIDSGNSNTSENSPNTGISDALGNGSENVSGTENRINISGAARVTLSKTSYVYDGKQKKPGATVKSGTVKLVKNTDYTVAYKNNKNVGTASVVITGNGKYTGKITKTFKILPKGTSVSGKIAAKSRGFTVKWKRQLVSITGYQVQYSTNKKFAKGTTSTKTISKSSSLKLTVNKLKANKKYYIRIRTYKNVNGKKYYSNWSKSKSVTTKK